MRFIKVQAGLIKNCKSDLQKTTRQTYKKLLPNNNKVNKNKEKDINTVPTSSVVVKSYPQNGDNVGISRKNGITSLGDLLKGRVLKKPDEPSRIYTPWQDHALRVAES
jgi:hypothetical protein